MKFWVLIAGLVFSSSVWAQPLTAKNLPGTYMVKAIDVFFAAEVTPKANGTYLYRDTNTQGITCQGTWKLSRGVFLGRLRCPMVDQEILQEINLRGLSWEQLNERTKVQIKSSLIGSEALTFTIQRVKN